MRPSGRISFTVTSSPFASLRPSADLPLALSCSLSPADTPSAFLADAPASTRRRNVGFIMFGCNDTNELTPASHTGSCVCPRAPCVRRSNQLRAFWPEPVSVFGSLSMTMPTAVHLGWVFHPACPSDRINARSRRNHLAAVSSSSRWKHVVPAASDPTVASRASTGHGSQVISRAKF